MNNGRQYIPVADVDGRIAKIEALLARLPVELEALKKLRAGAVLIDAPESRTEFLDKGIMVANNGALGPKAAVVNYLRRNPRTTSLDVVRMLERHVKTTAKNRKRLLKSTIYNLVANGTLDQDSAGHLTVTAKAGKEVP